MSVEDVSQLLPGEGPVEPVAEPVAAEPEPEPQPTPDPFRLKYRGEERELPYEAVAGMAAALDTTPEGVINALQRAREADRISRRNIQLEQEAAQRQQQYQAPAPEPRYAPPPPQYQPQQYQGYPPAPQADDDPIAMLRNLQRELGMTRTEFSEFKQAAQQQQQALEAQRQQAVEQQWIQQTDAQIERYLFDKNQGRKEKLELEDFKQEIVLNGGLNRYMPLEQAMERAFSWMTRDEQLQMARNDEMAKLRQPRAKVTVPGNTGGAAAPVAPPTAEQQIGGMTIEQMREYFPERR